MKKGKTIVPTLRRNAMHFVGRMIVYALLVEFVFLFLYPYLYMLVNSLKYDFDIKNLNNEWIITQINTFNYTEAFRLLNYWRSFGNSVLVTGLSTLGHVVSCSLIGYGLSRFRFPGKKVLFGAVLLSILVPSQLLMMPLYIQYASFKWIGTMLPIVIPSFFGFGLKGGLFIFIFRQFFAGLPKSYEEAAKIEGCNDFKVFWKIVIPISKTSVLLVSVLSMLWHWNDYFEPKSYLSGDNMVLTQRLSFLSSGYGVSSGVGGSINPVALAGCVLTILPVLIVYAVFQKQFMQGIERSGLAN